MINTCLAIALLAQVTSTDPCVTERNGLKYYQARPGHEAQAADFRAALDQCFARQAAAEANEQSLKNLARAMADNRAAAAARALEAKRLQADEQAAQQAAVERRWALREERDAEDRRNAVKPEMVRLVLTANLCAAHEERAATLAEIAKDRKYSRVAGVANLREREARRVALLDADQEIAVTRRRIRESRLAALPCGRRDVVQVRGCLDAPVLDVVDGRHDEQDICTHPVIQSHVRARPLIEKSFDD